MASPELGLELLLVSLRPLQLSLHEPQLMQQTLVLTNQRQVLVTIDKSEAGVCYFITAN